MARTVIDWCWDEAFSKFGFGDGDGLVMTGDVARFIESLNPQYRVKYSRWGIHNTTIDEIARVPSTDGATGWIIYPPTDPQYSPGYDDPRPYLPRELVKALDKKFGKGSCFG